MTFTEVQALGINYQLCCLAQLWATVASWNLTPLFFHTSRTTSTSLLYWALPKLMITGSLAYTAISLSYLKLFSSSHSCSVHQNQSEKPLQPYGMAAGGGRTSWVLVVPLFHCVALCPLLTSLASHWLLYKKGLEAKFLEVLFHSCCCCCC